MEDYKRRVFRGLTAQGFEFGTEKIALYECRLIIRNNTSGNNRA